MRAFGENVCAKTFGMKGTAIVITRTIAKMAEKFIFLNLFFFTFSLSLLLIFAWESIYKEVSNKLPSLIVSTKKRQDFFDNNQSR
jgi:hypothetical protein